MIFQNCGYSMVIYHGIWPEWAARRGGDGWVLSPALVELIEAFVIPTKTPGAGMDRAWVVLCSAPLHCCVPPLAVFSEKRGEY